jgi:hypothetical protein
MQVTLQLLCHYHLTGLQVHLLHAEKDPAFLQCPTEISKLFGPGTRCACLGEEIPLEGIGMDTASVAFHAHLHNTCKGHQSFLPHDHGTLSAI